MTPSEIAQVVRMPAGLIEEPEPQHTHVVISLRLPIEHWPEVKESLFQLAKDKHATIDVS